MKDDVPVTGLAVKSSLIPRIAPPPFGSSMAGATVSERVCFEFLMAELIVFEDALVSIDSHPNLILWYGGTLKNLSPHSRCSYLDAVTGLAEHYLLFPEMITNEMAKDYLLYRNNKKRE